VEGGSVPGDVVLTMRLEEMKRLGEKKLREMGLSLYEAWRCVEHLECPPGVDYGELYEAFWIYVDATEAIEGKSIIAELERRYTEEARARERRVQVPA